MFYYIIQLADALWTPSVGLMKLMTNREKEINSLKEMLQFIGSELEEIYSSGDNQLRENKTFFNLEFRMKNHIQKYFLHLANAKSEILSYFETTCLSGARIYGQAVKQDIVRNIIRNGIRSTRL